MTSAPSASRKTRKEKRSGSHANNPPPSHEGAGIRSVSAGRRGAYAAGILTFLLLIPFSGKAFNIDDTLFLYKAKQILQAPLHPYDFTIIWFGFRQSMWEATMNPPLNAYLISGWARLFGFSESALHLLYAALGGLCTVVIFKLCARFVSRPWIPTLFVVSSPAFFVSATSIMADIPLLLLYTSSVLLALEGTETDRPRILALSGVCCGLAFLTKYQAITLIPLLAVFIVAKDRRWPRRLPLLLIAGLVAIPWAVMSVVEHGRFHFFDALLYKPLYRPELPFYRRVLEAFPVGVIFLGAGAPFVAASLIALMAETRRRGWWLLLILTISAPFALGYGQRETWSWTVILGLGAVLILWYMVRLAIKPLSPNWLLMALWAAGFFIFLVAFNWTVAERIVLMMLPPFAIGTARYLELHPLGRFGRITAWSIIALSFSLSIPLATADAKFSACYRDFAREGLPQLTLPPSPIHFFGTWGFLYYMEEAGYIPSDQRTYRPREGDILVANKRNMPISPDMNHWRPITTYSCPNRIGVMTMNDGARAAFYSASPMTPFPYAFSRIPYETFTIYRFQ